MKKFVSKVLDVIDVLIPISVLAYVAYLWFFKYVNLEGYDGDILILIGLIAMWVVRIERMNKRNS
jgi:hypothetical protein